MPDHHLDWATPFSVSRILDQRWPMRYVPLEALERGTAVHRICEAIDTGSLVETPSEALEGYIASWKAFTNQTAPSWEWVERNFDCRDLGFHGIADRVGYVGPQGTMTVCDIKTGKPQGQRRTPTRTSVQTALYALGLFPRSYKAIQRMAVFLAPTRTYQVAIYDNPQDFLVAHQLLKEIHYGTDTGSTPLAATGR